MLQWLYTYIANISSQCFFCFFRRMLQVCLFGCCIYFTHMLQMFYLDAYVGVAMVFKCFRKCFNAYFKCFICLRTYVANISFGCYKNRLGVPHVAVELVAGGRWPATGLRLLPRAFLVQRVSPSPLPPLPFLPSISSRLFKLGGKPYPTSTQMPVEVVAPVGRQRRNARVVAPIHVVRSLRARNKQPRASVRTSGH
jgi:hypothetical protein